MCYADWCQRRGSEIEVPSNPAAGQLCDFFATNSHFIAPLGSNFAPFWDHVKELNYQN